MQKMENNAAFIWMTDLGMLMNEISQLEERLIFLISTEVSLIHGKTPSRLL